MSDQFFSQPILNSPYEYPGRHWELDKAGQPTGQLVEKRRPASYVTPVPLPKKRKGGAKQREMVFDEGQGLSTERQHYDPNPYINDLRRVLDKWRALPRPEQWGVTPDAEVACPLFLTGAHPGD